MPDTPDEPGEVKYLDVHRLIKQHPDRLGYGDAPEDLTGFILGPRIRPEGEVSEMTIVEFLRARLVEDERTARYATSLGAASPWVDSGGLLLALDENTGVHERVLEGTGHAGDVAVEHIARHDPARVLREVEAKRQIVDAFAVLDRDPARLNDAALHLQWNVLRTVVQTLALPYADHPDYRA